MGDQWRKRMVSSSNSLCRSCSRAKRHSRQNRLGSSCRLDVEPDGVAAAVVTGSSHGTNRPAPPQEASSRKVGEVFPSTYSHHYFLSGDIISPERDRQQSTAYPQQIEKPPAGELQAEPTYFALPHAANCGRNSRLAFQQAIN